MKRIGQCEYLVKDTGDAGGGADDGFADDDMYVQRNAAQVGEKVCNGRRKEQSETVKRLNRKGMSSVSHI